MIGEMFVWASFLKSTYTLEEEIDIIVISFCLFGYNRSTLCDHQITSFLNMSNAWQNWGIVSIKVVHTSND